MYTLTPADCQNDNHFKSNKTKTGKGKTNQKLFGTIGIFPVED
jgi:hypothetical protein